MKVLRVISSIVVVLTAYGMVSTQANRERPVTSQDLVSRDRVFSLDLSPDGKWLTYRVSKRLLAENKRSFERWMMGTSGTDSPRRVTGDAGNDLQWAPDSMSGAFVSARGDEIRILKVDGLTEKVVLRVSDVRVGFEGLELGSFARELKWSPDGKAIAFTIQSKGKKSSEPQDRRDPVKFWRAMEVTGETPVRAFEERDVWILCVVDIETGRVARLTDRSLDVGNWANFNWAPDGTRLVFEGQTAADAAVPHATNALRADLYIADRAGGARVLYGRKNAQMIGPVWSPDGKWIAFRLSSDVRFQGRDRIAVISQSGGQPRIITDEKMEGDDSELRWSQDSQYIYFGLTQHLKPEQFRVPIGGGVTEKVSPDNGVYGLLTYSADGKTTAYTSTTVGDPGAIWVASSTFSNKRRLVDLNPEWKDIARVSVETLKWRSEDNKWDIYGVLVKPPDYQEGKKYPLVVTLHGGPSPVSLARFELDIDMPALQLATKGYLVLAPSTRGRGGFGRDFALAFHNEKSYTAKSVGDVAAGVDELVRRGLVDANRVGVGGHSAGANLTSMIVARSNKFGAAWIGDMTVADRLGRAINLAGDRYKMAEEFGWYGVEFPLTSKEITNLIDDSPVLWAYNARTPTLMHCGEKSTHMSDKQGFGACRLFFGALRSNNVTSELRLWPNSMHSPATPLGQAETFDAQVEWFDYWLRGIATERMAKRYGPPRNADNTATAAKPQQK